MRKEPICTLQSTGSLSKNRLLNQRPRHRIPVGTARHGLEQRQNRSAQRTEKILQVRVLLVWGNAAILQLHLAPTMSPTAASTTPCSKPTATSIWVAYCTPLTQRLPRHAHPWHCQGAQ
eukprot:UN2299